MALSPYNVSLSASSTMFSYAPSRDGDVAAGWNASFTQATVWPVKIGNTTNRVSADALGLPFRRTQHDGATVALTFEGTAAYVCYSANGAAVTGGVDTSTLSSQAAVPAAGTSCADVGAQSLLAVTGLQYGTHTMRLQVAASASKEFRFYGGGITLGIGPQGSIIDASDIVDDQDPGWIYSPNRTPGQGWDATTDARYFRNTAEFICPYGQGTTATYLFTNASGFIVHGKVWADSHAFRISLDDQPVNMDASGIWDEGPPVFLAKGNLDPTVFHKLAIENFSSDVPNCPTAIGGFCCIGFDAVTLLKVAAVGTSPGSSSSASGLPENTAPPSGAQQTGDPEPRKSSNVGPIVGGVLGGLAAVGLIAAGLLLFLARRRQSKDPGVPPPAPLMLDRNHTMHQYGSADPWAEPAGMPHSSTSPSPVTTRRAYKSDRSGSQSQSQTSQLVGAAPAVSPSLHSYTQSQPSIRESEAERPRLADADLERVLDFVARRMDGVNGPPQLQELPQYRG